MFALKLLPKLAKIAKSFKLLGAAGSFAAYTWMFSWQMAAAIIILLFVHESGHIWAMKRTGMKTKGIYFIPFVGGAAVAEDAFTSRRQEAFVAIMGPVFGLGLILGVVGLHFITGKMMYAGIAAYMALVNAVQFLPITPLDGGRIIKSITMSIRGWLGLTVMGAGILLALVLLIKLKIWLFVVLLPFGILEFTIEWYRAREGLKAGAKMTPLLMAAYAFASIIVVGLLLGALFWANDIPGAQHALEVLM